jgi:hypothetical protein
MYRVVLGYPKRRHIHSIVCTAWCLISTRDNFTFSFSRPTRFAFPTFFSRGYRESHHNKANVSEVSPPYTSTRNPSFLIPVGHSLTPLFSYPSSVSCIRQLFNHPEFVNMTHRACSRASRFSPQIALPLFCKPLVH